MRRRAFTLMELMVGATMGVTLIGGLLAPALSRARESARRASCLSNIKQQLLGCIMFANEKGERFPFEPAYREMEDGGADAYVHGGAAVKEEDLDSPVIRFEADQPEIAYLGLSGPVPASAQANVVFMNRLYGNGKHGGGAGLIPDPRVFQCPAAPTRRPSPTGNRTFGMDDHFSYGVNHRTLGGRDMPPNGIVLGDMARTAVRNPWKPLTEAPGDAEARGLNHRREGFNFGFKDGHAKWHAFRGAAIRGVSDSSDNDNIFLSTGNRANNGQPETDIAFY